MNYLALPQSLVAMLNLADRVATATTAAADRVIAVWAFFTQPQAIATYRWLVAMTLALVELILLVAILVYARTAQRFSTKVKGDSLAFETAEQEADDDQEEETETVDDLPSLPELFEMADAIDTDYDCAPSLSHEDYLDRLIELQGMSLKALAPIAANLNLVTRKVRKGVLIEAILKAEGYQA